MSSEDNLEAELERKIKRPRKRKAGYRCMVYSCSNTAYDGYTIHEMPGKMPVGQQRFSNTQRAWINFIGTKRKFDAADARKYKRIVICSGHFEEEDYDQSQVQMCKFGLRKLAPSLKREAIPTVHIARQQFWTKPTPTAPVMPVVPAASATGMSMTMTMTTTMTTDESATHANSPTAMMSATPTSSSTTSAILACNSGTGLSPTSTTLSNMCMQDSVCLEPGMPGDVDMPSLSNSEPDPPSSLLRSPMSMTNNLSDVFPSGSEVSTHRERKTSHIRKKESVAIFRQYEEKKAEAKAEELAKDLQSRSKGEQCSVQMVEHKVGTRMSRRSCKVQVKTISVSKGVQTDLIKQPRPTVPALQYADSCTQTEQQNSADTEMDEDDEDECSFEEDDSSDDPTYKPGRTSSDEEIQKLTPPSNIIEEEKFIVFETNLLELFTICHNCLSTNIEVQKIRPKCFGSQLKIRAKCSACDHVREWYSQPKVGGVMAGNLLLSAAILFGGASPTKVLRVLSHMNVKAISNQTFLDHQSSYLQPAIIRVAHREQEMYINSLEQGEKLIVGGDGRCDSPGHSAKYGSYTFMDLKRNKVFDVQLVQSNEVKNSNAMEKEGLARGLARLAEKGVSVGTLITDRHAQVAKWIRETYPEISHRYDVWHIAKGVNKKIRALAQQKECELAGLWKRSIVNHIYWCAASTPDGNGDMMAAKFKSVLNHVKNVHEHESELYPKCAHQDDYPQREWMKEGTKVYEKLSEELSKTRLLNDMKRMSHVEQTSAVEAFHSVVLYWCPKMLAYSYAGMKCRLQLAAMHWNENANRGQATKADGTPMYRITYPKAKEGGHTVSKVLTACTFRYVEVLMEETIRLVSSNQKLRNELPELNRPAALCSSAQRADKAEAIQRMETMRRFSTQ